MTERIGVSLPDDLFHFLEGECKNNQGKSEVIQEELRNRQRRKRKITVNERIVYAFLLVAIGFTLWIFSMLILPITPDVSKYVAYLLGLGLLSLLAGYVTFYIIYKQRRRKKWTS